MIFFQSFYCARHCRHRDPSSLHANIIEQTFANADLRGEPIAIMLKTGDDLVRPFDFFRFVSLKRQCVWFVVFEHTAQRQDVLTLQMIKLMDKLWIAGKCCFMLAASIVRVRNLVVDRFGVQPVSCSA